MHFLENHFSFPALLWNFEEVCPFALLPPYTLKPEGKRYMTKALEEEIVFCVLGKGTSGEGVRGSVEEKWSGKSKSRAGENHHPLITTPKRVKTLGIPRDTPGFHLAKGVGRNKVPSQAQTTPTRWQSPNPCVCQRSERASLPLPSTPSRLLLANDGLASLLAACSQANPAFDRPSALCPQGRIFLREKGARVQPCHQLPLEQVRRVFYLQGGFALLRRIKAPPVWLQPWPADRNAFQWLSTPGSMHC